jgi:sugar lactone lactonase YvrE
MRASAGHAPRVTLAVVGCGIALTLFACDDDRSERGGDERESGHAHSASAADGVQTGVSTSSARFVRNLIGFQGPESVRYDPDQDVFFVSNMTGYGSALDGNGYISRVSASYPDSAMVFAQGGRNGVTLDAPKGLAIHGDTLWTADIHALRGFDRHTGAPLATIDFAALGAVQLNDVAIGPDDAIHVTDTGIIMGKDGVVHIGPDRIFVVGPNGVITVVAEGEQLRRPNGITWDSAAKRWLVVSFDPFVGEIAAMPADMKTREVIRNGKGQLDGVEVLAGGTVLFSSWADSSIHALAGGRDRQIIRDVPVAADIGIDTRRHRLAIPLSMLGRVQLWDIAGVEQAPAPR